MTGHLGNETLSALADGELQSQALGAVQAHLVECPACTREALACALLKSATARAGQRYQLPPALLEKLSRTAASSSAAAPSPALAASRRGSTRQPVRYAALGWAAALLLAVAVSAGWFFGERNDRQKAVVASAENALVSEVFDQHVAALATSTPPQVLSSDNHTVKPWFQGRLPFAFNLPEKLPDAMTLDGANLTYLNNQPAAQLLFSIGKHHVSVFAVARVGNAESDDLPPDHAGFHVMEFKAGDLEMIAISDANPARLAELVRAFEAAQGQQKK